MYKTDTERRILEDMFYAKPFFFSYSSLSKLLRSPAEFYKRYILKEKDDLTDTSMLEGRIIHNLLLENGAFDDRFVIAQTSLPSANIKSVIDMVYNTYLLERSALSDDIVPRTALGEFREEILTQLKEIDLYQDLKSDDTRVAKVVNPKGLDYFDFLKESTGKTIIDASTYSRCVDITDKLKNHKVMELMGMHPQQNIGDGTVLTEIEIKHEDDNLPFGIKGVIDNLYVDRKNKVIYINDLKTTRTSLVNFPTMAIDFDYWIQAAMYERLVRAAVKDQVDSDYTYVFNFIVIDKYGQIYAFRVTEDTMTNWQIDLQEKLHEAAYHYKNKDYSLPYKFLKTTITL